MNIQAILTSTLLLAVFQLSIQATAEETSETTVTTLSPEQVENYYFQIPPSQVEVKDLTMGQRAIMASKRRLGIDLITRQLGVINIRGTREDLATLQQVVDRRVLRKTQVEEWQSIGILFGDVLAKDFGLRWVSYEDEFGANKALRYRNSENYFFPITMFSKRVRFDEDIDMEEIYAKLESEMQEVIEYEKRPKLPNT